MVLTRSYKDPGEGLIFRVEFVEDNSSYHDIYKKTCFQVCEMKPQSWYANVRNIAIATKKSESHPVLHE